MKCPGCGKQHSRSRGMRCSCGYRFVLDPKVAPHYADGRIVSLVRRASANDTLYFTETQLYGRLCDAWHRGLSRRKSVFTTLVVLACVVALVGLGLESEGGLSVVALVAAAVFLAIRLLTNLSSPPKIRDLRIALAKWRHTGHPIEKLLMKPGLDAPPEEADEADLHDYGVERILIVQRDILVDLFVRNGWHTQERALVLAESGYPRYLLPVAERILAERPDLPVFLLHDSDRSGVAMRERLEKKPPITLAGHPLTDLGIFPADVAKMPRMRAFATERSGHAVGVDLLPYAALSDGLATCMWGDFTIAQSIERAERRDADDASGGSFG